MRTSFLDDVSAAEAGGRCGRTTCRCTCSSSGETCCRTGLISHEMSRSFGLEYPVDDPDDEDDDDFDGDEEDGDDEDDEEEEVETWQVSAPARFL
jgi:hypothetical protein